MNQKVCRWLCECRARLLSRPTEPKGKTPPVRYEAIEKCLATVDDKAKELSASIHMPRIGCGLAGGNWDAIEPLIERCPAFMFVKRRQTNTKQL